MKLNTGNSFGWFGGIRPDANEAAFQQMNARQTQSDIRIVDLDVLPLAPTSPPGLHFLNASAGGVRDRDLIKAVRQDPSAYYVNVHSTPNFPGGAIRGQLGK